MVVVNPWLVGFQLLCDASLDSTTETLFFAANMIHAKARKEWMRLADSDKTSIVSILQSLMDDARSGRRPVLQSAPVQSKLCGLLAVALCSAPDDCRALLNNLVDGSATADPTTLAFFLTFARCVCEELEEAELSFSAKDAMEIYVATLSRDVVRVLSDALLSNASTAVQGEALQCLRVWMKRAGLSLTRLYANHRDLLLALISSLGQRSVHLDTCGEILCQVFGVSEYPAASLQDEALKATTASLLSLRVAYASAVAAEEEEIAHSITNVVATFGEMYVDWIVEGEVAEAAVLGEWMLELTAHPKRQMASLTLEFWLLVQEVPVAERHRFFQRDAYVRLLDLLLQRCQYPGEADEVDEFEVDDLMAFRSAVADVLAAIFALLSQDFLALVLAHVAAQRASWPAVEVCLFAVSMIATELRKRIAPGPMEQGIAQVLDLLFGGAQRHHPLVVTSGSKLLGHFGSWFQAAAVSSQSLDTIVAVLQYLDQGLHVAESRENASRSMMQVLTSCSTCVADVPPAFVTSVVQHFGNREIVIADRLLIVEGLTRLAAVSRYSQDIVRALLDDALGRLSQVLTSGASLNEGLAAVIVSEELQVCGKLIRFLDAPTDLAGGRALTRMAVEMIWPALTPVAARFESQEKVMDALFEVYGWSLQSLREDDAVGDELPALASLVARVFNAQHFVAPLECAAIAVDVAGRRPECVQLFRELLTALATTALLHFQSRGVDDAPDVLRALFELAYRCLLYCPEAVVTGKALTELLALARACVGNQHRHATNAVLTFVIYLLQESRGKLQPFHATIDTMVWADSGTLQQWVDAVVHALFLTTPSVLFESVARLLQALWVPAFDMYGQAVAAVTSQTLLAAVTPEQLMSESECRRVVELLFAYAQTPTKMNDRKFRSLSTDVAKICRKELTPDALLGYEDDAP